MCTKAFETFDSHSKQKPQIVPSMKRNPTNDAVQQYLLAMRGFPSLYFARPSRNFIHQSMRFDDRTNGK